MRRIFVLLALFSAVIVAQAQHPLSYPRLVVFGDSYSDGQNTYNATKSTTQGYDPQGNPITIFDAYPSLIYGYHDGVFTNGFDTAAGATTLFTGVWHQQLHTLLAGVPLAAPVLNSGNSTPPATNYAWGAATTASGFTNITYAGHLNVMAHNMNRQIDDYLNAGYTPDAKTLYVLFGGLNDLLADSSTAAATAAAANVTAEAKRLIDAGAVNVLIANVPGISANAASPIDVSANVFAAQLSMDLAALQAAYALKGTPANLIPFDVHQLYSNIFANPAAFGFTDVIDHANVPGANGSTPSNVDQYLQWDGTNPTTAGHRQIAIAACTALTGTVTSLVSSSATPTVGAPATLTATVSTTGTYGPRNATVPTGSVTFYATSSSTRTTLTVGSANVSPSGVATLTTAVLVPDSYTLFAIYSGDTTFATGCNSNAVTVQIAVATQSFDFTIYPAAEAYVGMEESAALVMTGVPIGAFNDKVTFTCSNLPKFFSCLFYNYQTVPVGLANGATYPVQLFIGTGTPTKKAALEPPPGTRPSGIAFAVLIATPLLLFASRRRLRPTLLAAIITLALISASGCTATPASTTTPDPDPGFGTTHGPGITYAATGTYTLTITGTSATGLVVSHPYTVYIANTYDVGVTP